jgi:Leucine-rich repeat (LRR) protein
MSSIKNYSDQDIEDIEELAELYSEAENIEYLNLSINRIKAIPECVQEFINLKYIDLSRNELESIRNINQCISLEHLNLSNNLLKSTSEGFFNLKNLKHLDLSNNQLTINNYMINSFKYNKHLNSLSLHDNLNYDFNKTKFTCLETLLQLEILDNVVIFKQTKNKSTPLTCSFKGSTGKEVKVKSIKDYIKFKKEELNNPVTVKNTNSKKIILPEQNTQNKLKGFYYFSNMIIDK